MQRLMKQMISESTGELYTLVRSEDGTTSCSCPAWQFGTRPCKHLNAIDWSSDEETFVPSKNLILHNQLHDSDLLVKRTSGETTRVAIACNSKCALPNG